MKINKLASMAGHTRSVILEGFFLLTYEIEPDWSNLPLTLPLSQIEERFGMNRAFQ